MHKECHMPTPMLPASGQCPLFCINIQHNPINNCFSDYSTDAQLHAPLAPVLTSNPIQLSKTNACLSIPGSFFFFFFCMCAYQIGYIKEYQTQRGCHSNQLYQSYPTSEGPGAACTPLLLSLLSAALGAPCYCSSLHCVPPAAVCCSPDPHCTVYPTAAALYAPSPPHGCSMQPAIAPICTSPCQNGAYVCT